jgi:Yip1 domain
MLMQRIIGAFTFRKGVYKDVEEDASFTGTAWLIVVVVALLSMLGASGFREAWLLATLIGTVANVVGFAIAAFVVAWAGKTFFQAEVDFNEMVRTLGLAYVWRVIGVIGILGGFLSCLLAPVQFIAFIAGLVAWFIAAKEALDLEWGQTIITVIIGWLIIVVFTIITGVILGALGIGAYAVGSAFGL